MTERFPADTELQGAWDAYPDAYDLAHRSLDMGDGIIAGKFWAKWLDLFDRRRGDEAQGQNIVRFPSALVVARRSNR